MTKTKLAIALSACMALASVAQAQQMKIATGSPKGTYHAMYSNIADKCNTQMPIIGVNTSGSLENIDKLAGKEVGAVFVQTDALFASAQGRDMGNIKTLVALHKESIHVVAPVASGLRTSGNMIGMGKEDIVFRSAEDLSGYKVAVAGGALVAAQQIKLQGQLNWVIVPVASADAALAAAKSGQVQAAILVGGQPLGNVKALGSDFKLLGIGKQTADLLKTVYVADKLSYPKLSASAVTTIATEALLVTRTYNTPAKIAELANLRKCIIDHIPEWQDADGAHPSWAQVDPNNKGKWTYYDLPAGK